MATMIMMLMTMTESTVNIMAAQQCLLMPILQWFVMALRALLQLQLLQAWI